MGMFLISRNFENVDLGKPQGGAPHLFNNLIKKIKYINSKINHFI